METTLYQVYDDAPAAQEAAKRIREAGVSPDAIRLIAMGSGMHSGTFADSSAHDHDTQRDHVGSFADSGTHDHDVQRDHVGSFADSSAHDHDAQRDKMGSFATGAMMSELADAGLDADTAQKVMQQLQSAAAVLVVRADEAMADKLRGLL